MSCSKKQVSGNTCLLAIQPEPHSLRRNREPFKGAAMRQRPDSTFVNVQAARMKELLHRRATLSREDLEYTVQQVAKLKDERLKSCVAELVGWGDDERYEIETFVAIAIEVMRLSTVSRLRDAARTIEMRHLMGRVTEDCNG